MMARAIHNASLRAGQRGLNLRLTRDVAISPDEQAGAWQYELVDRMTMKVVRFHDLALFDHALRKIEEGYIVNQ